MYQEQRNNEFWKSYQGTLSFPDNAPFSLQGLIEVLVALIHATSSSKGQQVADDTTMFWRVFTVSFLQQAYQTACGQNKKTLSSWLYRVLSADDTYNPTLRDAVSAFGTLRPGNSGALVRD
jgi:hypothetical protein